MTQVSTAELASWLNSTLDIARFKDYCPNGLQVEGKPYIGKLVTGVTASLALIDAAIARQADAILVHHGWFWKNENPCIVGTRKTRIERVLSHQLNLLGYHLPLDAHQHPRHPAQPEQAHRGVQTEPGAQVVGDREHLLRCQPVQAGVQDAGEAAGRRRLVGHVEVQVDALVVVERSRRSPEPGWPADLVPLPGKRRQKKYGETILWLAEHPGADDAHE